MKTTKTGYRISKNGKVIDSIEKEAFQSAINLGKVTKQESVYYFFERKQGGTYIYLP